MAHDPNTRQRPPGHDEPPVTERFLQERSGPLRGLNWPVTVASSVIVLGFLIFGAGWTETAGTVFQWVQDKALVGFKWLYITLVTVILAFVIWLGFGRYKNVRLGGDDEVPEYGLMSWFAMLFAAGMGIGLIFWSVSEPLSHFAGNPFAEQAESPQAAATAMRLTLFHWGLHPWAVYAFVALTLAYFGYRRNLPLTIRTTLYPLAGSRIWGPLGHAVDTAAVFGTAFGVATSLGLGVQQMSTGLNRMFGLPPTQTVQLGIVAAVTLAATVSVYSGVRRGIRVLSDINLLLSFFVMALLLAAGPTLFLLGLVPQTVGQYFQHLPEQSLYTGALGPSEWQEAWTLYYWGWWVAWSPFVGLFIARVSRGRTLREFVTGVMLAPTILTVVWLVVFGGTGLHQELNSDGNLLSALNEDVTLPLFTLFDNLAVPQVMGAGLITLLVAIYFVTSCDSGTLAIVTMLSCGGENPPVRHRITWGLTLGAIAAVLLVAGGLQALQAAAIAAGLPFSLVMVLMLVSFVRGLRREEPQAPRDRTVFTRPAEPWTGRG